MGLQNELCLLTVLATATGVLAGDLCYVYPNSFSDRTLTWCDYGCCGSKCCTADVALIVGLSVGGFLLLCTVIAVVCCCVRRRAAHGQVIRTNAGQPAMVVTTAQTNMAPGQPMYPTGGYQPGVHAPPPGQAYPMGVQYPQGQYPPPGTAAMAPPSYSQAAGGGQANPAFDYKRMG